MVEDYPENYIQPQLRIKRTRLFRALEDNLNQTRLTDDSVHKCVKEYLRGFQETCDLEVISGYVDSHQFKEATYYFVGRERVEPFRHFWRKADIDLSLDPDHVNPTAWSEWEPINIPASDRLLDIRPVFWGGRLFVVWADWAAPVFDPDAVLIRSGEMKIQTASLTLNGEWSTPIVLGSVERNERFDEAGGRLVAAVFAEMNSRDDRLAVYFTNRATAAVTAEPFLDVFDSRDTMMRKRPVDLAALLEMATVRFKDASTLQYKILPDDRPSIKVERVTPHEDEIVGEFNAKLGLEAVISRELVGSVWMDTLRIRGTCSYKATWEKPKATFTLSFMAKGPNDPVDQVVVLALDGNARSPWMVIRREALPIDAGMPFKFAITEPNTTGKNPSTNVYTVKKYQNPRDYKLPKLLKTADNAAQFLDFNESVTGQKFRYTRLNTVIGPQLTARAEISVAAVLDWTTQHLIEPGWPGDAQAEAKGPFESANGLYLWELFFHLVHLVTYRLRSEGRFLEAQRWSHYLFDPQLMEESFEETDPDVPDAPKYWRCRPLVEEGDTVYELAKPNDPDAIAYGEPRHYRIAVFMDYVRTQIEWGDWLYRQLNRDDLASAQLHYLRAQALMGEEPEFGTASDWVPKTVNELQNSMDQREVLRRFEQTYVMAPEDWPKAKAIRPYLAALGVEGFRAPVNQTLLNTYSEIRQRLFNLRNNLTLDGRPIDLPLYSPAADPRQLLLAQAAGSAGLLRRMGGQLVVPPYRFRVMLDLAMSALETHARFGEQLRQYLEQRDRGRQEELQYLQMSELGRFAIAMQNETISQLQVAREALVQSRAQVQARATHYEQLSNEYVSSAEYQVMDQILAAKIASATSSGVTSAAAVLNSAPNIFGVASGGMNWGAILHAVGGVAHVIADGLLMDADRKASSEQYRRRQQEWNYNVQQARLEQAAIDLQLQAQDHAIRAAQASLRHTETANAQTLAMYAFLKQERDISVDFSGWMVGQMKNLYFPAHDAVVSLCQTAETCMRYEIGDYESESFVRSEVWQEKYHGLTASESLKLDLLRMSAEYHKRNERRLELVKTVSLRELFDHQDLYGKQSDESWSAALAALVNESKTGGTLMFDLSQRLFDYDYPGHYCRQILSVSVSLPVTTGPYEDVRAILTQTASRILTQANESSLKFMYDENSGSGGPDIKVNLRVSQQIGISKGVDDMGMVDFSATTDRYLPFEGTGAVSRWILRFSRHNKQAQMRLLKSLTDVILTINYTVKVGASDYAELAETLVDTPPVKP
nr:neuraminidase-like domain-containing protein [Pseudomonas atagonensis]